SSASTATIREPRRSSSRRFSRTSGFIVISTVRDIVYDTYCMIHSIICQGNNAMQLKKTRATTDLHGSHGLRAGRKGEAKIDHGGHGKGLGLKTKATADCAGRSIPCETKAPKSVRGISMIRGLRASLTPIRVIRVNPWLLLLSACSR